MNRPDNPSSNASGNSSPRVFLGFTATGSNKHIIDQWNRQGKSTRSVCNIYVRDIDEMVSEFNLGNDEVDKLLQMKWCSRCQKWLKTMRYFRSMGKETIVPGDVIDVLSKELGYDTGASAQIIDFAGWKKSHGYK